MKYIPIINNLNYLILFMILKGINSLVVFPFRTLENNNIKTPFNIENTIYSNILIGDSEKISDIFYSSNIYSYYFDEEICKGDNFYSNNFSSNISLQEYVLDEDEDEKAIKINESLSFFIDLNLTKKIKIKNFPILIKINQINSAKLCLLIGLLFRTSGPFKLINFIEQLKLFKLIDNYAWTIKYISENEGLFIIGSEPHIYDTENYNESDLKTLNQPIIRNNYNWNINFNKIYSGKNIISENNFCIISHVNKFIMGNKEYNNAILKEFFLEYLNKNICHFHHDSLKQNYYYCNKSLFSKEDINNFPELSLFNADLEKNFIFNGEELFFEDKDFYYFKIYFNDYSQRNWLIGKMFLKKYQLIFDYDKRTIGYYSHKNILENERKNQSSQNSKNNNKLFTVILIIIIGILLILTKICFSHLLLNKHRKKLINELLEEENIKNKKSTENMLLDIIIEK